MVNPIDAKFSDDFHKFVLQDQTQVPLINPAAKAPKPFKFEKTKKSDKSKKGKTKKKHPFGFLQNEDEE